MDRSCTLSFPTRLTKKELFKNRKKERQLRKKRSNVTDVTDSHYKSAENTNINAKKVRFSDEGRYEGNNSGSVCSNDNVSEHCQDAAIGNSSKSTTTDDVVVGHEALSITEESIKPTNGKLSNAVDDPEKTTTPSESSDVSSIEDGAYYSVSCKHCNTKVAVTDRDEVYHFFNVITGY